MFLAMFKFKTIWLPFLIRSWAVRNVLRGNRAAVKNPTEKCPVHILSLSLIQRVYSLMIFLQRSKTNHHVKGDQAL